MILKHKLKKIIDAIEDTSIRSVEISSFWGAQKIKLSKNGRDEISNSSINLKEEVNKNLDDNKNNNKDKLDISKEKTNIISTDETIDDDIYTEIKAPLVGTFYMSPKPGEPQFVNVGDIISSGQTLCIIEAMKIFNEIESEFNGKIVEILINDGEPVEYDQPLFKIKPE